METQTDTEVFQEILYRFFHIGEITRGFYLLNNGINQIITTDRVFSKAKGIQVIIPEVS
ncbi:MAG: hypothetical protein AB1796_01225 [Bacillota bacterium]